MKNLILPVVLFAFLFQTPQAQKLDYMDIRDSLKSFSCGPGIDSSDIFGSIRRLESFDPNLLGENINQYYNDLASSYWLLSNRDIKYLEKTIELSMSALYHKRNDTRALNALVYAYMLLKNCDQGVYYMNLYKKHTPKRYWNENDISIEKRYLSLCGNL